MKYNRLPNETDTELIYRVCKDREEIGTWQDVADILNPMLNANHTESKYRRQFKRIASASVLPDDDVAIDDRMLHALRIERVKVADERAALKQVIRDTARIDGLIETLAQTIQQNVVPKWSYTAMVEEARPCDLVVHLTDLHMGANVDMPWNKYNAEIAALRLYEYLDRIIEIQNANHADTCHLVLGGDMISGLIHFDLRAESKQNLVEQIVAASELISSFTFELCKLFNNVVVYSVSGNHSRAVADKKLALRGEEFDALIPYYMRSSLQNVNNLTVKDRNADPTITVFDVRNHLFCAVHGDKDTPAAVINNMSLLCDRRPEVIIMGHRHENAMFSSGGTTVFQSGTVMGMSTLSVDMRAVCKPEQWAFLVTDEQAVSVAYPIRLH